jgi:hypothetical protein
MTNAEKLHNHLGNISVQIAKIDDTVSSTEKMPIEQIAVHRKKREDLQQTASYLKHLLMEARKQEEELKGESKIITM